MVVLTNTSFSGRLPHVMWFISFLVSSMGLTYAITSKTTLTTLKYVAAWPDPATSVAREQKP